MNLTRYKDFLIQVRTQVEILEGQRDGLRTQVQEAEKRAECLRIAQDIMNQVGVLAQSEIKDVIEHLVSQALQFTHGPNYSFEMDNRVVRNQPETYLYVLIDGVRNQLAKPPQDEIGGSVVDVVCFALRVVFWAIRVPRTEPVLLLDEPFKNGGKQEALCQMIKYLSDLLGIQFVIITYDDRIVGIADSCYRVTQTEGISQVERIK